MGDTNLANFEDAESTLAPKDVVLVLTHGLCVVVGATATMIKCVKSGDAVPSHNPEHGRETLIKPFIHAGV